MNAPIPQPTPSLFFRQLVREDTSKILVMSREAGMRTWIPDQVYRDEQHAGEVVNHLIDQYRNPNMPTGAPYVLGICLKTSSELIGHVGLSPILKDQVELGYAIEDRFQGRGYATQAVGAMAELGIHHLGLPHVLGIVASDNIASCRVLEKSGFNLMAQTERQLHNWHGIVKTYKRNV